MLSKRHCHIESASVENAAGAADGEYGLHREEGSPQYIADLIGECLRETELISGTGTRSNPIYLNLRIQITIDDDE